MVMLISCIAKGALSSSGGQLLKRYGLRGFISILALKDGNLNSDHII